MNHAEEKLITLGLGLEVARGTKHRASLKLHAARDSQMLSLP